MEEIEAAPGVLPFTDAVLGGRGVAAPDMAGFAPETVRLTPSDTDARGRGVVEDLSKEAAPSGDAIDAREMGLGGGATVSPVGGVAALVAGVGALTAGTDALGASDWRRVGTAEGGIAFEAEVVGLVTAGVAEEDLVAGAEVVDLLRALEASFVAAGAALAFVAVGVGLTVPDPNVPELMIYRPCSRAPEAERQSR